MAGNTGSGSRVSYVKGKKQVYNPKNGKYIKIGLNGKFEKVKKDGTPFKGVRKIKPKKDNEEPNTKIKSKIKSKTAIKSKSKILS